MSILLAVLRSNFGSNLLRAGTTAFGTLRNWISASCSSGVVCGTLRSCLEFPNVACLTRSEDEARRCLHFDAPNDGWLAFRATEAEGLRRYVCCPRSVNVNGEMLVENRPPTFIRFTHWCWVRVTDSIQTSVNRSGGDIHSKFRADPSVVPVVVVVVVITIIIIIIIYCSWVVTRWQ
jgi:hypothetical protein